MLPVIECEHRAKPDGNSKCKKYSLTVTETGCKKCLAGNPPKITVKPITQGTVPIVKSVEAPRVKGTRVTGRLYMPEDLAKGSILLAQKVLESGIKYSHLVGMPRSGMIVASHMATFMGLPLYTFDGTNIIPVGKGTRRLVDNKGIPLYVEDSCHMFTSFNRLGDERLKAGHTAAVIRSTFNQCDRVDYWVWQEADVWFWWHMWGSALLMNAGTDFDGVLCRDWKLDEDYETFLNTVPINAVPAPNGVMSIVTARLEKYRPQTEAWLRRYGVKYRNLIMGPWKDESRDGACIGTWKAQQIKRLGHQIFIESDVRQAAVIRKLLPRVKVICVDDRTIGHGANTPSPKTGRTLCEHAGRVLSRSPCCELKSRYVCNRGVNGQKGVIPLIDCETCGQWSEI